jgi:serine/threonine-protein kinase
MGAVYLGTHVRIKKQIAVKFLHQEFAFKPELVKRFYREAQAATAIGHENIIDVMDVGVAPGGEPFLVMEYLEGESLAQLLSRNGPLDLPAACGILEPALRALGAAHEKGIVHRDLKPENMFLVCRPNQPPKLKLIDFGISKFTGPSDKSHLTETGTMLGTPAYMAPEQVRGDKDVGTRADLYSIGVIFYEMLTGRFPFEGKHYNELLANVLTADPTLPSVIYPAFPKEAEPLIMRLLSRDPANRPADAAEVVEALKTLPGYVDAEARLIAVASGLTDKTFAGGDLGAALDATHASGEVAAEILSSMTGGDTAAEWSRTLPELKSKRKGRFIIAGVVSAVLVLGGTVALMSFQKSKKPDVSGVSTAAADQTEATVLTAKAPENENAEKAKNARVGIEVLGIPADASIFFNDVSIPVGENPFKVENTGHVKAKLRIEAPGFERYETLLLADRDQQIRAQLVPLKKEDVQSTAAVDEKPSAAKGAPRKKAEKKAEKPEEKKGAFSKAFKDFPSSADGN